MIVLIAFCHYDPCTVWLRFSRSCPVGYRYLLLTAAVDPRNGRQGMVVQVSSIFWNLYRNRLFGRISPIIIDVRKEVQMEQETPFEGERVPVGQRLAFVRR